LALNHTSSDWWSLANPCAAFVVRPDFHRNLPSDAFQQMVTGPGCSRMDSKSENSDENPALSLVDGSSTTPGPLPDSPLLKRSGFSRLHGAPA
jgi:hypothetical protein